MNELFRPLDLRIKGEYILDLEENYFNIKEAVFYLDKKTESMSEEEFSYWIKKMNQDRMFVSTYFNLDKDLESPVFWFLKKGNDQLSQGITIIINLLLDANSVLTKVARNVVDDIENYHLAILLFDIKLSSWGLRGDPFLFEELKTFFASHLIPNNCKAFEQILYQECERLIGQRMELNQSVFIERYDKGGMSSGHVDINFWINTIFPKLKQKFKELMPVSKQK